MSCTWTQDYDSNVYETSCGEAFQLEDGTPGANNMRFCCYCGKKLVEELVDPEEMRDGEVGPGYPPDAMPLG